MNNRTTSMLLDAMNIAETVEVGATQGDATVMSLVEVGGSVEKVKKESKKDIAGRIYSEMVGQKRALVIAAMMAQAGLSKAGAGTYYQNFASGKWAS